MGTKILYVANHAGFSKFNAPYFELCRQRGWTVDNASPGIEVGRVDHHFDVAIQRSPFSLKNLKAYRQLKKIINSGRYDIIHCQTPTAAMLTRVAARSARKQGTKVIYSAHGFHFFKGAPLTYWLLFYPVEAILARVTDMLVVVNGEDYERAVRRIPCKRICTVNGMGVDFKRFKPYATAEEKIQKRKELKINGNDFVLLYAAQFIARKNHKMLIQALPKLLREIPNLKVLFAGHGPLLTDMQELSRRLHVEHIISFLGGRRDVDALYKISDLHVSVSLQEGLATCNVEAMACALPVVVSRIRGHVDVCKNEVNGLLFDLNCPDEMINAIIRLYKDKQLYQKISSNNIKDIQAYSIENVLDSLGGFYNELINQNKLQ
jgi:glycosyltransferase EpsD